MARRWTGVLVQGYTYSEAPGSWATVMLDGTVRHHDALTFATPSPNGRWVATQEAAAGTTCFFYDVLFRNVRLIDLDTGAILNAAQDPIRAFYPTHEFSPDGETAIVAASDIQP